MIRPRRQRTLRVALIAAFALLIAQLGAVRHLYAHGVESSVVTLKQPLPGAHEFCGDCLNFAPLLATAGGAGAIAFDGTPPRHDRYAAAPRTVGGGRPLLAFRSRAPPTAH